MHKAGHHQAEDHVEDKIPPAHIEAAGFRLFRVGGDGEELLPEDEMHGAQDDKQAEGLHHVGRRHDQEFADQGALEFLVAAGALAQDQDGSRRRDDIDDADERLLGDALVAAACEGQHDCPHEGKPEGEGIALPVMHIVAGEQGDAGAEGGSLGQREVHENDAALDNVQPEINQQPGEDQAGDQGPFH